MVIHKLSDFAVTMMIPVDEVTLSKQALPLFEYLYGNQEISFLEMVILWSMDFKQNI